MMMKSQMTGGNMTSLGYHSTTSMAVKAVVTEVKKRLAKRFNFLEGFPDFFYDFDKGLSDQFKQYYAQVPERERQKEWIVLAYSYDSASRSTVQSRNGFSYYRPVTDTLKREIDFQYCELPILFSVLTNTSKALNGLANYIGIKFDWSFSVDYQDLLWPTWVPNHSYPKGWYVRPAVPNDCLYMTTNTGVSGDTEPDWLTEVSKEQTDNELSWLCIKPDMLRVKAGSFVKNDSIIQNPMDTGIMYQYDFGYTLHYTDYDDAGTLTGIVTEVSLELLNYYREGLFSEKIEVKAPNF